MSSMMSANPNAQRSLARGAGKESTKELLDDDRAHRTPRMRELVGFCLRVMESVEQGDNRHTGGKADGVTHAARGSN
jgi:hypothetical protein